MTDFESVFELVGGRGRYQWSRCLLCMALITIMTWNHLGYIFTGAVPPHWCRVDSLQTSGWTEDQIKNISLPRVSQVGKSKGKYESCSYYDLDYAQLLEQSKGQFETAYQLAHGNREGLEVNQCQEWSYDRSIYSSTIPTEFNLVCGRRYLVASIQAVYMIGALVGGMVFGPLNDKVLGRRRTVLIANCIVIVGGFVSAFSVSHWMVMVTRFLVATGTAASMQAAGILVMELADTSSRAMFYCIYNMFFGIGYSLIPLYAYFIRDWSHLQLAFSSTTLILLSYIWIFPESPRWLATNGQDEEAVKLLLQIAKVNGMPPPKKEELMRIVKGCRDAPKLDQEIPLKSSNEKEVEMGSNQVKKISVVGKIISGVKNYKELVATRELRRVSFTVWILFVSVTFIYYGFAFSSTKLTTNPYLLVSLGALMEVPASLVPIPFLSRWGRRKTVVLCYALTGLTALGTVLVPMEYTGARTVLNMTAKLFVACAFTIVYLIASEVYPTVVRTTGKATAALMGRFGSIAAPFAADLLSTVYPDLPIIIFGIVALVATFVALLIPEMKDMHMTDYVHQVKIEAGRKLSVRG